MTCVLCLVPSTCASLSSLQELCAERPVSFASVDRAAAVGSKEAMRLHFGREDGRLGFLTLEQEGDLRHKASKASAGRLQASRCLHCRARSRPPAPPPPSPSSTACLFVHLLTITTASSRPLPVPSSRADVC